MTIAFTHNGKQVTCNAKPVSGMGQGMWYLYENRFYKGAIVQTANGWIYHGHYEAAADEILKQFKEHVMTDLEKFVELYRSFGIECKVVEYERIKRILLNSGSKYITGNLDDDTKSEKFDGHAGSEVMFDLTGKFIQQGFWE